MPQKTIFLMATCLCLLFENTGGAQEVTLSLQKDVSITEEFKSFSPDGRYMAGADMIGNFSIYDIQKGVLQSAYTNQGVEMQFLSDGQHIASWGILNSNLKIINFLTGKEIGSYNYPIQTLSAGGDLLAYHIKSSWRDSINYLRSDILWQQWEEEGSVTFTDTMQINRLKSLDQQQIDQLFQHYYNALKENPGDIIQLLDPITGTPVGKVRSGFDEVQCIAIDRQSRQIAVVGAYLIDTLNSNRSSCMLRVIDISTSAIIYEKSISDYCNYLQVLQFSSTGRYLAYSQEKGPAIINIKSGEEMVQLESIGSKSHIRFSNDDRYLLNIQQEEQTDASIYALPKYRAQIIDLLTGKEIRRFPVGIYTFDIHPDFREMVYWAYTPEYPKKTDRRIVFVNMETGIEKPLSIPGDYGSQGIIYTPDGKYLLFARSGKLAYWGLHQSKEIKKNDEQGLQILSSSFHAGRNNLLLTTNKGVWSIQIDKELTIKRLPIDSAYYCDTDENGKMLIYSKYLPDTKCVISAYSIPEGKNQQYFQLDSGIISTNLSTSPSGQFFAATLYQWYVNGSDSCMGRTYLSIGDTNKGKSLEMSQSL
ncbi:MAG: hypothetical protein IPN33_26650 [Saprospiraceae bacterium]|nr:hypothetical protein [Saprospiraceae bacterium]